jgi:hypothetical protein
MSRIKTKFIEANAVTNPKLAQVATSTLKGRKTSGTGNVEDLSASDATSILDVMVGDSGSGGTKGLVPAPVAGDATKFLRGDGTFADAPGGVSGDIAPTTWSGLADNSSNDSIVGLDFSTSIMSFEALLHVYVNATTDTYATYKLLGTRNDPTDWTGADLQVEYTGAGNLLTFSIDSSGQVRVTTGVISGFTSGFIRFRAQVL